MDGVALDYHVSTGVAVVIIAADTKQKTITSCAEVRKLRHWTISDVVLSPVLPLAVRVTGSQRGEF